MILRSGDSLQSRMEEQKADYQAAKQSPYGRRRTGLPPMGAGADWHWRNEDQYFGVVEKARDFARNDVAIKPVVDRAVANICGEGFLLDPKTGDPELDIELQAAWEAYALDPRACDLAQIHNFYALTDLVCASLFIDGDIFGIPVSDGSVELVEGHRCRTPRVNTRNMVLGIELDLLRRRVAYWFSKRDIGIREVIVNEAAMTSYPALDEFRSPQVLHVFSPHRVSATRGVSAFAPVFEQAGFVEDINFAQLVRMQIISCFAILRSRQLGFGTTADKPLGEQGTQLAQTGRTEQTTHFKPGIEYSGAPGETLEGFSPRVPNPEYLPFIKHILQLISTAIGLPLCVTLLDGSETNFSGWRGAMDQARIGFRRVQKTLIDRFCRPVYLAWLRRRAITDPGIQKVARLSNIELAGHRWIRPRWPYIEPYKDALANDLLLATNQRSHSEVSADDQRDWQERAPEIVKNRALIIRESLIEAQNLRALPGSEDVNWRHLATGDYALGASKAPAPSGDPASGAATARKALGHELAQEAGV